MVVTAASYAPIAQYYLGGGSLENVEVVAVIKRAHARTLRGKFGGVNPRSSAVNIFMGCSPHSFLRAQKRPFHWIQARPRLISTGRPSSTVGFHPMADIPLFHSYSLIK
jgi:hypothetical protein